MNPFKIISTKKIYENPWMSLEENHVEKNGKDWIFAITTIWSGVCILCIDEENNILLVQEFKYALNREDINLPGWWIDWDESPLDSAKRELEEETGYIAEEWISLGHIHPLTTILRETEYLFLARKIKKTNKKEDNWENTTLIKLTFSQAIEMVMKSEITHWASVAAILKAQQYIV